MMPDCEVESHCDFFQVYMTAGKTYGLEKMLKDIEERARHSGTTDSELSELEDKVASAAAQVQHAESEVIALAWRHISLTQQR